MLQSTFLSTKYSLLDVSKVCCCREIVIYLTLFCLECDQIQYRYEVSDPKNPSKKKKTGRVGIQFFLYRTITANLNVS